MSEVTVTTPGRVAVEQLLGGKIAAPLRHLRRVIAPGAKTVALLGPDDTGALVQAATSGTVVYLPPAAVAAGYCVGVQNVGGAIDVVIRPDGTDGIQGTIGAVTASGGDSADWSNPSATAVAGDYCWLVSDGGADWWIVGGVGVWESAS